MESQKIRMHALKFFFTAYVTADPPAPLRSNEHVSPLGSCWRQVQVGGAYAPGDAADVPAVDSNQHATGQEGQAAPP